MQQKIVFTLSIMLLLLLPIVYSEDFLGYYKKNTDIDIKVPCELNNYICQSSASCNITIIDPNSNTLVDNSVMINNLTYFKYSLINNKTSNVGDYLNIVNCIDGNLTSSQSFYITINNSGLKPLNYSSLFPIIIGFILIIIYFFIIGIINVTSIVLKTFSFIFSFIELIIMIGILYINEFGGMPNELLRINFYSIAIIGFVLLIITLVNMSMNMIDPSSNIEENPKWQSNNKSKW